jgi:hypothetical protein
MKSAAEVRMNDLNLSERAHRAIVSAGGFTRPNPSVRDIIESVTAARLLAVDGVGKATVAEVETAIREACGSAFIDSTPAASAE